MGTVFRHISDDALRKCGGTQCHHCERSRIPVFSYPGKIIDPSLAANPELALNSPEIDELCAECINGGNVQRRGTLQAEKIIRRFASDPAEAWYEFNRIPDVPLFLQEFDWPMCCGRWTDFTGSPRSQSDLALLKHRMPWSGGPTKECRNFERDGPPESLREISLFDCSFCGKKYFVDQCT